MNNFISRNLYYSLLTICFVLLYIIGPIISGYLYAQGIYKPFSTSIIINSAIFFTILSISYFFFKKIKTNKSKIRDKKHNKLIIYIPLFLTGLALALYFAKNGLVLSNINSYEDRYTANFGAGIYTQLMQLFYFFIAGLIIRNGLKKPKTIIVLSSVFFIFTFALLGGHRQLGLGAIIGVFLYLTIERKISFKLFLPTMVFFTIISLIVAILRYQNQDLDLTGIINQVIIFFYDGITPLEAHSNINDYLTTHSAPGTEIITSQFGAYIPRSLWPDKPLLMMNGGNYYTSVILSRASLVTYSPTILGELMLAHGDAAVFMAIPIGAILAFIDRTINSRSYFGIILILFSFILVFNLYREGFYVFLSKFIIIYLFSRAFLLISKKKLKSTANPFHYKESIQNTNHAQN